MITEVTGFLQQTDRIVWGPWLIFLLLGCGCYLMISLFFLPLRNLLAALGLVFHPKSRKGTDGEGVSSFSALTTELAATIGTGNIVGVATAMVLGGPGALFWMLLSGIIGLSTKLVESTLCVRYRVRITKENRWVVPCMFFKMHFRIDVWGGSLRYCLRYSQY